MANGTLFFVHGAGNRDAEAAATAASLRAGFGLADRPDRLVVSDWGQALAPDAALPRLDETLPAASGSGPALLGPTAGLGAGAGIAPGQGAMLDDPWAPLAALSGPAGAEDLLATASHDDADQFLAFLASGLVNTDGLGVGQDDLVRAATRVRSSHHYRAARGAPMEVLDATATSVAALALGDAKAREPAGGAAAPKATGDAKAREPTGGGAAREPTGATGPSATSLAVPAEAFGLPGIPWADIGELKDRFAQAIGGAGVLSVAGSFLGPLLGPTLLLWATRMVEPHRAEIMHAHMLMAVDVLFYQRHGDPIRDHVRAELAALQGPVVALGHSLGGIILVDALFGPGAPPADVALLVTFGSQSAFLAAIGALDAVAPDRPWLNVWSRTDFVSFLASGMWPGRVTDEELVIDIGFPESHGAYATTPGFFSAVTAHPDFPAGIVGPTPPAT